MRIEKTIDLTSRTVTVRELTVGEIRAILKQQVAAIARRAAQAQARALAAESGEELEFDAWVDEYLSTRHDLDNLLAMTDLDQAAADQLTPREYHEIDAVMREVNADFFADRVALLMQ